MEDWVVGRLAGDLRLFEDEEVMSEFSMVDASRIRARCFLVAIPPPGFQRQASKVGVPPGPTAPELPPSDLVCGIIEEDGRA
eukprot:3919484-Pyramimonas_sp.AAC.1